MNDSPKRLKDVLGTVTRRLGMEDAANAGELWRRWAEIVGAEIAHHAEPTSLRSGVLRIRTDSPVWATEIGYLTTEIRTRINQKLGKDVVREVKVWTAPGPIRPPKREARNDKSVAEPRVGRDSDDPAEALERARSAWARRHAR